MAAVLAVYLPYGSECSTRKVFLSHKDERKKRHPIKFHVSPFMLQTHSEAFSGTNVVTPSIHQLLSSTGQQPISRDSVDQVAKK